MRILKFDKEKNDIEFENYTFCGLSILINIETKEITSDSFKIFWKIELEKENKAFNEVYEGNSQDYLIKELSDDINYKIRICTLFKNTNSL